MSAKQRKRDLVIIDFPRSRNGGVDEIDAYISELYEWASKQLADTINWYFVDKRMKRRMSQWLRAFTILLAATGGVQPLVGLTINRAYPSELGYVFLAIAGACIGFDRFFGLSAAWMRDISAAQALKTVLDNFRLSWASLELDPALQSSGVAGNLVKERLDLINTAVTQSSAIVKSETDEWINEFHSALADIGNILKTSAHR